MKSVVTELQIGWQTREILQQLNSFTLFRENFKCSSPGNSRSTSRSTQAKSHLFQKCLCPSLVVTGLLYHLPSCHLPIRDHLSLFLPKEVENTLIGAKGQFYPGLQFMSTTRHNSQLFSPNERVGIPTSCPWEQEWTNGWMISLHLEKTLVTPSSPDSVQSPDEPPCIL